MYRNKGKSFVETWDFHGFGEENYHIREVLYSSYNKKNNLIRSVQQWNDDADGTPESQFSRYIEYDRHGNSKEEHSGYDFHSGGLGSEEITTYEYDRKGNLLVKDYVADPYEVGEFTYGWTEHYAYDRRNNLISKVYEEDRDLDGVVDEKNIWLYSYDKKGNLIKEVVQSADRNEDGYPDYETITDYSYNKRNHLISYDTLRYMNGESAGPSEYVSYDAVYDKKGNLIHEEIDDPIMFDFVISRDYEYDERGRLVTETSYDPFDYGEDGKGVLHYIYDNKNNLVKVDYALYSGENEPDFQPLATYEYDKEGNLTEKQILANVGDLYNDGQVGIYQYDYNKADVLVREQRDYGADGTIDYEYTRSPVDPDSLLS